MRLGAVCAEPNAGGRARPLRTRASQIRGLSRPPLSRTSQISQVATGATTFLNDDAYDGNDADPTCFQSDNVLFARLEAATQSLLAFTAIAEEDLDAKVPTHRPPRLSKLVDVVGSVPEFDWHSATASDALMTELINTLRNGDSTLREPVILRGAADGWPCVADGTKTWTLTNLVKNHADFEGETRVRNNENSNTLSQQEFQYVEGNHPAVKNGTFKAPSRVEQLTIADVAKRMTGKQSDGNISGNVYMQAALSHALAQDAGIDEKQLQEPWLSFQAAGWVETQEPRIWLSQAGSTSSLHYDTSVSVLAQVNGLKRMLLYPPSALSKAYLYPDWHPLRRRSGVRLDQDSNRNDAAHCAFPRWSGSDVGVDGRAQEGHGRDTRGAEKENAASVNKSGRTSSKPPGAWEAVLGPGDVLVFPPRWAHYTESVGPRVASSVTKRYKVPKTNDDMRVSEALQKLVAGNENENETDASETETGTGTSSNANAHSSQVARFARWQKRKGGPSLGTRDLGQLERSGVVRAMRQRVLRLDERGRVLREDVAYLSRSGNKSGTNYLSGRGGLEQFREQWRLCAEDAACVATSALEGYGVHTQSSNTSAAPNTGEGRVVGVYLRGSAARGDAIAGVSDLDLVVLCWDDGSTSAKTLKKALRESFTRRANDSGNSVRSASNSGSSSSWTSRWQHLATKADTKLVLVPPPPHPAGVAVVNVLDGVESHTKSQFLLFEALALCLGKEGEYFPLTTFRLPDCPYETELSFLSLSFLRACGGKRDGRGGGLAKNASGRVSDPTRAVRLHVTRGRSGGPGGWRRAQFEGTAGRGFPKSGGTAFYL